MESHWGCYNSYMMGRVSYMMGIVRLNQPIIGDCVTSRKSHDESRRVIIHVSGQRDFFC